MRWTVCFHKGQGRFDLSRGAVHYFKRSIFYDDIFNRLSHAREFQMITVDSISKKFKLYRSPADRLKELVTRRTYHTDFQALNEISFTVADGETLGIIGQNGAGKSTLLKILTGILMPDRGTISLDGRITGLLELGTGFNAEMTGIENIYMNGTLLGMARDEIDRKKDTIAEFAELGEFIYEQLKTYSSGMVMRLAFSIAIHADPKCFVVDEALSVGDAYFQQKCMGRIKEFRKSGGSIIFVSHDLNAVKMLCDKAILLNQGNILEEGSPEKVVNSYNFVISKMSDKENKVRFEDKKSMSHGTFEARISEVVVFGEDSKSDVIASGEAAEITVKIESYADYDEMTSGILIRDRFGQDIFGTNLYLNNLKFSVQNGKTYLIKYHMKMDMGPGKYTITAAVHRNPYLDNRRLHWIDKVASFEVAGIQGNSFVGVCRLHPKIEISECQ
jgi:lipopolysaccharide transport system ATP-binding protein